MSPGIRGAGRRVGDGDAAAVESSRVERREIVAGGDVVGRPAARHVAGRATQTERMELHVVVETRDRRVAKDRRDLRLVPRGKEQAAPLKRGPSACRSGHGIAGACAAMSVRFSNVSSMTNPAARNAAIARPYASGSAPKYRPNSSGVRYRGFGFPGSATMRGTARARSRVDPAGGLRSISIRPATLRRRTRRASPRGSSDALLRPAGAPSSGAKRPHRPVGQMRSQSKRAGRKRISRRRVLLIW